MALCTSVFTGRPSLSCFTRAVVNAKNKQGRTDDNGPKRDIEFSHDFFLTMIIKKGSS
jgi:hypothetical protein